MEQKQTSLLAGRYLDEFDKTAWMVAELQIGCKRKIVVASAHIPRSGVRLVTEHNGPARRGVSPECKNIVGACGCRHAEPRLIEKCIARGYDVDQKVFRVADATFKAGVFLVTHSPCSACARAILDHPWVIGIVYDELTQHDQEGVEILQGAGVDVLSLPELRTPNKEVHDTLERWRNTD